MQALDKGDNHTTEVGLNPENKKLNRFVDMTVCKLTCCRYDYHVGKAVSLRQNKLSFKLMIIFAQVRAGYDRGDLNRHFVSIVYTLTISLHYAMSLVHLIMHGYTHSQE